jgi:TrmH family RNA methyltransferase
VSVITSPHNERIKLVRALQSQARARRKAGRVALEGVRLVRDAFAAGERPDFVLYTPDADAPDKESVSLLASLREEAIPCLAVTPEVMAHAADTQTPQGVIAVFGMPDLRIPPALSLALDLDGVADPGNLGTMLRTAAAAGVDGVFLAPGCVDPFNPKALRSGMGAHFRVPVASMGWDSIAARLGSLAVFLADARADTPYTAVDWRQPAALIVGGEARGAQADARRLATTTITIPMANAAESLNAAAAGAVILFECRRQRLIKLQGDRT